jgi:hypothetical protein
MRATPSAALAKLSGPLAPLLPRLELGATGLACIAGSENVAEAAARLRAAGHVEDEARLFAYALPRREAVWWACMCARAVPDPGLPAADAGALDAAEQWVRKPEEANRRAALAAAEATAYRTAEAWAAQAAGWSGGSLAPEGQPVVPPADHLCATAVIGAVRLAALRHDRVDLLGERLGRFLVSAREIAAGGAGRIPPEGR